jgi:hypothetical protein
LLLLAAACCCLLLLLAAAAAAVIYGESCCHGDSALTGISVFCIPSLHLKIPLEPMSIESGPSATASPSVAVSSARPLAKRLAVLISQVLLFAVLIHIRVIKHDAVAPFSRDGDRVAVQ